jgi:predicted DNA-binding protein with PD1-like motif
MDLHGWHVLRLRPGDDLRASLESWTRERAVAAGFIAAAVGSLSVAQLRFAGRDEGTRLDGPLELVALSGTLSPDSAHLHASVSDADGRVTGGHLLPGCLVRTTAEIVVGVPPGVAFARVHDPATGYRELEIRPLTPRGSDEAPGTG